MPLSLTNDSTRGARLLREFTFAQESLSWVWMGPGFVQMSPERRRMSEAEKGLCEWKLERQREERRVLRSGLKRSDGEREDEMVQLV